MWIGCPKFAVSTENKITLSKLLRTLLNVYIFLRFYSHSFMMFGSWFIRCASPSLGFTQISWDDTWTYTILDCDVIKLCTVYSLITLPVTSLLDRVLCNLTITPYINLMITILLDAVQRTSFSDMHPANFSDPFWGRWINCNLTQSNRQSNVNVHFLVHVC